MEESKELKEALAECAALFEKKCGTRPYMIVIARANLYFKDDEDKNKGRLSGTSEYTYISKPPMDKTGVSKLLIDTTRLAVNHAEKSIADKEG